MSDSTVFARYVRKGGYSFVPFAGTKFEVAQAVLAGVSGGS